MISKIFSRVLSSTPPALVLSPVTLWAPMWLLHSEPCSSMTPATWLHDFGTMYIH
ncbi:hypothetical protein I3843_10G040100 [Carya illinoinensis]|nr:hypothetical protein I3843_10G040100 [Carya illinoinensis]